MNEYFFNMFKDEGQKRIGNQFNILITNRMSVRCFGVSGRTLMICRQSVSVSVYIQVVPVSGILTMEALMEDQFKDVLLN